MAQARKSNDKMMTLAEAAQVLRVSYFQAHQMMLVGELEGAKRGHRWMVDRDSVERAIRSKVPDAGNV